jgi:hypothetical protein
VWVKCRRAGIADRRRRCLQRERHHSTGWSNLESPKYAGSPFPRKSHNLTIGQVTRETGELYHLDIGTWQSLADWPKMWKKPVAFGGDLDIVALPRTHPPPPPVGAEAGGGTSGTRLQVGTV